MDEEKKGRVSSFLFSLLQGSLLPSRKVIAMIGETLVNRYQILEKIGDGGMALVYKAKDTLLNRLVAVKVLRSQFATDEKFIERFRREAQNAASLSHPNVVNIYDVGHSGETHFIVMEYVQGRNLNEIIREHQGLSEAFVTEVSSQIAEALGHAHQHEIIHRDIKPHNILITRDCRVKVTDFGIAQAMSSANLTQTGMVLGSVHYFSPEQAKGNSVGMRTDLYSLGVVMYEMLVGRLPFRGDTPISIALKQIQETPVPLRELNPSVSREMEALVLTCLAKDPLRRPESAEEIVLELEKNPANRPIVKEVDAVDEEKEVDESVAQKSTSKRRKSKKKKRSTRLYYSLVVVALFVVVLWGAQRVIPQILFPKEVIVPNIVGISRWEAEHRLGERQLLLGIDLEVYDGTVPPGYVISQDPSAGRSVKQNRVILVRVSKGAEYVSMPSVIGQSTREARLNLTQGGFILGEEEEVFAPDTPINTIVGQYPAPGETVRRGIPVNLMVSKGREPVAMINLPDFRGLPLDAVRQELNRINLKLGNAWPEYSTVYRAQQVIEQNPAPNTQVELGSLVDVVYSQGLPAAPPTSQEDSDELRRWTAESQWESAEIRIEVPSNQSQEVVILVIDDFGAREVFREVRPGGSTITRTVQGRGEGAKIQVYIGGQMSFDKFFRDL